MITEGWLRSRLTHSAGRRAIVPSIPCGLRRSARPFVIEFVDHEDAVAVAEVHELFAVGVVGAADVVETEVFEYSDAFLDRCRVGCGSEGTERVVVGDAFEEQFLPLRRKPKSGEYSMLRMPNVSDMRSATFPSGGEEGEA